MLPHSAFRGQTPDEMYFGTGDAVPADLASHAATARRARVEANRSAACVTCPQSTWPPDHQQLPSVDHPDPRPVRLGTKPPTARERE